MPDWKQIQTAIETETTQLIDTQHRQSIAGGCINQCLKIGNDSHSYFIKLNRADLSTMFEAEFHGLEEIARSQSIQVPKPIAWGIAGDASYLVMDFINLTAPQVDSGAQFGEALAAMHQFTQAEHGWHLNNTIGLTAQINQPQQDWPEFWRQQRLVFQLELAQENGASSNLIDRGYQLADNLRAFFTSYQPVASCLHGDLWSGNWAFDQSGQVVIFDPALYYGDRETDIAMTELFGGAGADFYAAYNHAFPLDSGYATRRKLYNLYHILNHFNLFGGGYAAQAENMTQQLLSEI